jgi:hypothetical protein
MKNIAKKYPKVWTTFVIWLINKPNHLFEYEINEPNKWEEIFNVPFEELFGYLVLEFFPKYKIKIRETSSGRWKVQDAKSAPVNYYCDTHKEAIDKACEILENQL